MGWWMRFWYDQKRSSFQKGDMDTSLLEVPDRIDITGFYILWEPGFCCE
jgi:hypothetical protein